MVTTSRLRSATTSEAEPLVGFEAEMPKRSNDGTLVPSVDQAQFGKVIVSTVFNPRPSAASTATVNSARSEVKLGGRTLIKTRCHPSLTYSWWREPSGAVLVLNVPICCCVEETKQ